MQANPLGMKCLEKGMSKIEVNKSKRRKSGHINLINIKDFHRKNFTVFFLKGYLFRVFNMVIKICINTNNISK